MATKTFSQNHPQIACFALSGDPTAVKLVTNHYIFIKWPQVKLSGRKRGVLHHKVAPRPQTRPESGKKLSSQIHPQNSTFRIVRGSDSCYIGYQPFYFHEMVLSKVVRAQEGFPTLQSGSVTTNTAWIGQKKRKAKITPKIAHSALSGVLTAVTSVTNPSTFIQWP